MDKIALVTGAYRGLGLQTCYELAQKGITPLLSARKKAEGEAAVAKLQQKGCTAHFIELDVTDPSSISAAYERLLREFGKVDILINNAAIYDSYDFLKNRSLETLEKELQTQREHFFKSFEVNIVGAYQLCDLFIEGMLKQGWGRIVNVSSQMGQLKSMGVECPFYRITKTGLNAVTKVFAARAKGTNVLVNSVCPGWVRTEMGGPHAPKSVEDGVVEIVKAATLPDGSPSGCFFQEGKILDW